MYSITNQKGQLTLALVLGPIFKLISPEVFQKKMSQVVKANFAAAWKNTTNKNNNKHNSKCFVVKIKVLLSLCLPSLPLLQ